MLKGDARAGPPACVCHARLLRTGTPEQKASREAHVWLYVCDDVCLCTATNCWRTELGRLTLSALKRRGFRANSPPHTHTPTDFRGWMRLIASSFKLPPLTPSPFWHTPVCMYVCMCVCVCMYVYLRRGQMCKGPEVYTRDQTVWGFGVGRTCTRVAPMPSFRI